MEIEVMETIHVLDPSFKVDGQMGWTGHSMALKVDVYAAKWSILNGRGL